MVLSSNTEFPLPSFPPEKLKQLSQWVKVAVYDPFFERNDGVVRDGDVLRTHFRTAFRDIAVTDALGLLKLVNAILRIEGMKLEARYEDEKSGTNKLLVQMVIAQHVAHVLAEKAFDALAKF